MISRYVVEGHSMEPSLWAGDKVFVITKFFKTHKGDVVVFSDGKKDLIKRIKSIKGNTCVVSGDDTRHSSTWYVPRKKIKGKLLSKY